MALHFDFTHIKDFEDVCFISTGETNAEGEPTYRQDPFLDALIWTCLQVDLRGVTTKNIDEFEVRMLMVQKAGLGIGVTHYDQETGGKHEEHLTRAHLEKFCGLTTNVGQKTRKTWMRKLAKMIEDHALTTIRYRKEREARESVEKEVKN